MSAVEPFYEEVGRRIQYLRSRKCLSQGALGHLLSPPVTRASIANIESGKQRILAHTLIQLADILEVEITDIVVQKTPPAQLVRERAIVAAKIEAEMAEKMSLSPGEVKELTARMKRPVKELKR